MMEPAAAVTDANRPRYWDKRVAAAYLRILGATQEEAASSVGRAARTLREWEAHWSWPAARFEAEGRWLSEAKDASRRAVLKSVRAGNADLGMTLLERLDDRLLPPKQRSEITGRNGGPIETRDLSDDELQQRARQLGNRLRPILQNGNGAKGDR